MLKLLRFNMEPLLIPWDEISSIIPMGNNLMEVEWEPHPGEYKTAIGYKATHIHCW